LSLTVPSSWIMMMLLLTGLAYLMIIGLLSVDGVWSLLLCSGVMGFGMQQLIRPSGPSLTKCMFVLLLQRPCCPPEMRRRDQWHHKRK
jgi:hypothetical protein